MKKLFDDTGSMDHVQLSSDEYCCLVEIFHLMFGDDVRMGDDSIVMFANGLIAIRRLVFNKPRDTEKLFSAIIDLVRENENLLETNVYLKSKLKEDN